MTKIFLAHFSHDRTDAPPTANFPCRKILWMKSSSSNVTYTRRFGEAFREWSEMIQRIKCTREIFSNQEMSISDFRVGTSDITWSLKISNVEYQLRNSRIIMRGSAPTHTRKFPNQSHMWGPYYALLHSYSLRVHSFFSPRKPFHFTIMFFLLQRASTQNTFVGREGDANVHFPENNFSQFLGLECVRCVHVA